MLLPALLIDKNVGAVLTAYSDILSSGLRIIDLDAKGVVSIEPVAACLLACASRAKRAEGKSIRIHGLRRNLTPILADFDAGIELVESSRHDDQEEFGPTTVSRHVASSASGNDAANDMASYMAQYIPAEDRAGMQLDQYGLRLHHSIQPALAYVLAELVDNVFCHAATAEYRDPNAWIAVQSYPTGDLMRVAVVDDGCGLLGSLRGVPDNPPKNHFEAATRAFQPFLTSKGVPLLYTERRHMGLGLPVCGEISRRLEGGIYTVSGNAWVEYPNTIHQVNRTAERFFQGTVVALELHRRGATPNLLREILARFSGSPDLRLRFT